MYKSLGRITTVAAGTPVQVTANESDPRALIMAHSIIVQQVEGNAGKIYLKSLVNGDYGTILTIPVPTLNGAGKAEVLPWEELKFDSGINAIVANQLYIDTEFGAESADVSLSIS